MPSLTLSHNPHHDLVGHIELYGGKLGSLEFIKKLYLDHPEEFDETGIKVGPQYTPTIIPGGGSMTEDDFAAFMNKHHLAEWSEIMVRVSVPGDYRSLVDTMPTKSLNISPIEYWKDLPDGSRDLLFEPEGATRIVTPCDKVNEVCRQIRGRVEEIKGDILQYANLAGVPFSMDTLTYGVVPRFSKGHITVTEHPNLDQTYIEEHFQEHGYRPSGVRIGKPEDYFKSPLAKVQKFLQFLRKKGVLDKEIAYSFELGKNDSDELILFQIRELCRKVPTPSPALTLRGYNNDYIGTILTTIPSGGSKIFELCSKSNDSIQTPVGVPLFGEFRGGSLSSLDSITLDPNKSGILTESNRNPTIGGHDVMRQAQYALQSPGGGIVVLGEFSDGCGSYISDIERDCKPTPSYDENLSRDYQEGSAKLEVMHFSDGYIEIKKLSSFNGED